MDPDSIELSDLTRSFAYMKIANEIDGCDDREELKNIAKSFCKLYYKQQETIEFVGLSFTNSDSFT